MGFHSKQLATTALGLLLSISASAGNAQESSGEELVLEEIVVLTASEQTKQAPGVSRISAEDLAKAPPARDVSEIVRKMPGVNLTGNTTSGNRGNQRQIDLRGMGPENTLILIDGKPVLSRNSVRFSFGGERDTRGDSNWVPAEAIERIEVLRGPAAARYGSGAAGGVVNIITKRPDKQTVSATTYFHIPESALEGGSRRANLMIGGPIGESVSYRVYGNYSVSDPDKLDINGPLVPVLNQAGQPVMNADGTPQMRAQAAGREGVVYKDVAALLSWRINPEHSLDFEAGWSRQSNRYAGDTLFGGTTNPVLQGLAEQGAETNRMTRSTLSTTHRGQYSFGESESYIQWERTDNRRFQEGQAGSGEGTISTGGAGPQLVTSTLDVLSGRSEWDIPLSIGVEQMLTVGLEYRGEFFDDPGSVQGGGNLPGGANLGVPNQAANRPTNIQAHLIGLYFEDNMQITDRFVLTPAVRFDWHDKFGFNFSPSLNASVNVTDDITIKAGVARAFKAPNLFQTNPSYIYTSRGNGCPPGQGPCYILGNADLSPERSINKEIGINYTNDRGWNAGITYFHNNYENKIITGDTVFGVIGGVPNPFGPGLINNYAFRWENGGPGVISGLEANLTVPIVQDKLALSINATKMLESRNAQGQPYSLIPEHTINASLEWQALESLGFSLSATHYGKITPPTVGAGYGNSPITGVGLTPREAYTLVNLGVNYKPNEHFRLSAGVNNLFNTQLLRTGQGANTFNEPGRSYFISLTGTF